MPSETALLVESPRAAASLTAVLLAVAAPGRPARMEGASRAARSSPRQAIRTLWLIESGGCFRFLRLSLHVSGVVWG